MKKEIYYINWGLGIGDWGLGIGDWAQSPIPNPQSPFKTIIYNIYNKCFFIYYLKNVYKKI